MAKFHCSVISYTLQRTVDLTVVIPSIGIPEALRGGELDHRPKHKYPVLYLLHGMGNDHTAWSSYTNVEFFAEERNIALVMMSGENQDYIDHDGEASANKLQFFQFLAKELPQFVCGYFPISDRPEDTYIAGLSMGGWGTAVHALSQPERFAACGIFSGALMVDNPYKEKYPPEKLLEQAVKAGKKLPKLYMACGKKDFVWDSNVSFRDKARKLGADLTWYEHPDYGHEWRFWSSVIEPFLDWLPRTDPYAGRKRPM